MSETALMTAESSYFLRDWKKQQTAILKRTQPNLTKKEISAFLDELIEEKLVNPKALMINNYVNMTLDVDLLSMYNWFENTKPIAGGFGVFYRNQSQAVNPAANMLKNFLDLRKVFKNKLKEYLETSYEYSTFDRRQMTEKINANSFYGASGAPTSNFYNLFTATSVTATGQSLISTTEQAFEMFLSNSIKFIDLDECFVYLENIRNETFKLDDRILPTVPIESLMTHLQSMFEDYDEAHTPLLLGYLSTLHPTIISRMYYKNNIFAFSYLPSVRKSLTQIMKKTTEFKDPAELPEETSHLIKELWGLYQEFVFYNHFTFNRIGRLKNDKRKAVIVVDTDSNMLNLHPWIKFLDKYVIEPDEKIKARDADDLRFIGINTMCYFLTQMITSVLQKYTKTSNIMKEYRSMINMKNEFLFTRLVLSNKKKRYIASIRLREGKEIYPEKIDIKGMDFNKSTTREETKQYFITMLKDRILYSDDIDIPEVLRDLEAFENLILKSLKDGERHFLIPNSVKELEAYKKPFGQQGVRGVLVWNAVYPDMQVQLPEKLDIVKVNMDTPEMIESLKESEPKIYDRLMEKIFNNPNPDISKKGIKVVAIPKNIERIPEWLLPFVDYNSIVNDNLSRFDSVLKSLGIDTLKTSKHKYFTNILSI